MDEDIKLLRQFVNEGSEPAFSELVRRKIDFVYGVALRQVGGDAHLARDAAQEVFLDLAQKARELAGRPLLVSWLYTSTRFAAASVVRKQTRWLNRQTKAQAMHDILSPATQIEPDWAELRSVLDAAMHDLSEADRTVVLLRYFEHRRLAEIGRHLGLAEHAVGRRVERALEKLRGHLAKRGITSTAAALGAVLAQQPAVAAPAGLAATVAGTALSAVPAAVGGGASLSFLMSMTKFKIAAVVTLVALGAGAIVATKRQFESRRATDTAIIRRQTQEISTLRDENLRLKEAKLKIENNPLSSIAPPTSGASARPGSNASAGSSTSSLAMLIAFLDFQKQGLIHPGQLPFLGSDGKFTPVFTGLFAVTPAEQTGLQEVVDAAQRQLREVALANATAEVAADGSVVIHVAPFADGDEIYTRMLEAFQKTLGPERQNAFVALAADQLRLALGGFGSSAQTLTLIHNPSPTDPAQTYRVTDLQVTLHGHDRDTRTFSDLAAVTAKYGALTKLIPQGF